MTVDASGASSSQANAVAPPGQPQFVDSGLLCFVLVARFHQVPVTPEGIRHQYAPLPNELGEPDTLGDGADVEFDEGA